MRNIKIVVQYDGTRYSGWQSQEHDENTIQGKLTAVLSRLLGEKIELAGSGRTDAGVHALGQVANFKTRSQMPCGELLEKLNHYLPEDIGVISAEEVDGRFHSRLNAVRKTYSYHIWNSPVHNVFDRRYTWAIDQPLDVPAMRRAAAELTGIHDYKAFSSIKRGKKSTVRTIEAIEIEQTGADITLSFTGNGFLYHMVRILTGTLVEVGLHRKTPEDMAMILESLDREQAGVMAPGQGLFLVRVEY
ncbi:tRNA pseudouridine(38-40) synthase TruA [Anaerosacchariphilus sp. NSJ-68]|uniref:tRNA pseudouridine synthase A n=2 Tax=Lachnospiraceae TaxID=186803 RepID=A0A923LA84_9FIRM|nr:MULTISPECIES: tRNA pseudouridine(38-40) synthase TruA [Lachnospiraceae]MBC5658821.1 tRNA pseudouridine(38-40) synthase TruA [Anaerosacchariphilus hominis]MBC5698910.1 tRNA pseudouridine(38-40) synthase TruA [Roseburia difficilis]